MRSPDGTIKKRKRYAAGGEDDKGTAGCAIGGEKTPPVAVSPPTEQTRAWQRVAAASCCKPVK